MAYQIHQYFLLVEKNHHQNHHIHYQGTFHLHLHNYYPYNNLDNNYYVDTMYYLLDMNDYYYYFLDYEKDIYSLFDTVHNVARYFHQYHLHLNVELQFLFRNI